MTISHPLIMDFEGNLQSERMKKLFIAATTLVVSALTAMTAKAVEPTWEYSVQVSAAVQASPAKVTLSWPQDTLGTPSSYTVYRKAAGATSWGSGVALSGATTNYIDSSIAAGTAYEYQVVKAASSYNGYGYIYTGVNVPLVESRGKVVLVVDNTYATQLATELTRLESDLVGDGWTVVRHDVARTATVATVKNLIKTTYNSDPANVKSVFLFGHVAVPYSGNIVPDGHAPDHTGAWPADAFYGDMDGSWTDNSVNNAGATDVRNDNVPGDGKFDQSTIPSAVELQVGRVDLANMPGRKTWGGPATFASELDLLRQYLNKDHNFRHKVTNPQRRGVVGDYFGTRNGEAFAASGFRAFAPFFGADGIKNMNKDYNDQKGVWVTELKNNDYLWAYGCGAGSYASIGGLGNSGSFNDIYTTELVENNLKATFTMMFGSWLGDWDTEDNILRGVLATKDYGLTACWSGRPHWFYHHMGLGENIGYSARLTQNNNAALYRNQANSAAGSIHVALMGDPTLRMHVVAPVSNLGGSSLANVVNLSWTASADSVVGYNVYRGSSANGTYTKINSSLVTSTSFSDLSPLTGATYMVRAVKLESTPSGSYYNASQGMFWTVGGVVGPVLDTIAPAVSLTAPVAGATVTNSVMTVSANATDNIGVIGVQFKLDGANMGSEVLIAPFSKAWSMTDVSAGQHTLTAVARDLAGNQTTATAVTFTVPTPSTGGGSSGGSTNTTGTVVWVDDALPTSAAGGSEGGDSWSWVNSPTPFSGTVAHQSALATGLHQHYFDSATATMAVATGDKLFAYVYLDPANPPSELMLQWCDGSWEHRAYWGANTITYGTSGTVSRYNAGALPATGQWVRLEVPASAVGLEGKTVKGMAFTAYGGRVTWDYAGKSNGTVVTPPADTTAPAVAISAPVNSATVSGAAVSVTASATDAVGVAGVQFRLDGSNLGSEVTAAPYTVSWNTTNVANGAHSLAAVARDAAGNKSTNTVSVTVNNVAAPTNSTETATVWVDNAVPAGASSGSEGGDTWSWVSSNPAPYSGAVAHQSAIATGLHQHYFDWATATLTVNAGDKLFTYIYLDPANTPSEVMLQWNDGSWEHRAYWGANTITSGVNGTASRYYAGALPAAGQWVRLEVPASAVGLEGKTVRGMAFTLYGGRATWDYAGKSAAGSGTTTPTTPALPMVTASITDATAVIGTTDNAVVAFNRTGDTSSALTVNYTLGGSAVKWSDYRRPEGDMPVAITIPAGSASANLTLVAIANVGSVNPQTVSLALATDSAYTVGTSSNLVVNLSSGTGTSGGTSGGSSTNSTSTNIVGTVSNLVSSVVNYTALELPKTGDSGLNILSPTTLELKAIGTKLSGGVPTLWNLVNSGTFSAPALSQFAVTVNGQPVTVTAVGFKRRPLYAPLANYDLRIDNNLYLQLATPIADNATVEVKNPSGTLWSSAMQFTAKAEPLRYSPAIHVNQEGYVPSLPKKAMIGYYLGNLGEMDIASSLGFSLVNIQNGATVFTGTLKVRADVGYVYSPAPYQKVLEADFSSFTTPGEYQLKVAGLGASLPFLIDDGIAMGFTRAYALGLYHQRCGTNNVMPYTRHTHDNCHHDLVNVPMPSSSYQFTWTTISNYAMKANPDNVAQTAPKLTSPANQLFPFIKTNALDLSGGHHDAGDYSKYTINSANLIHYLMFAVDSVPGIAALDNLGVPESGDGISDVLQAAKWEADYVAKLQDTDGGFYFLVYPREREYESGTQPDQGDSQVVWPKTTASTAASVAALAQTASSPLFKQKYPAEAAAYMAKAKLGWSFLTNAITRYGKAGSYQKITHYGDDSTHDDELAWAAAEMFAATGEAQYQQKLNEWFPDPSSSSTFRWGWWRLYGCYGHAVRSYAFAARSGRLNVNQLNAAYLAKCEGQVIAAADDALLWSNQGAYGSSFPAATKRVRGAGWYFSNEQAFDIVVAQQITPKATYVDAMLANLNYEAGCNPVNVSYLTGMGWKRQREIVHQYAQSDRRVMPPAGIPQGNIQAGFIYSEKYGSELTALTFPNDDASTAPYPYYDRWADNFNVTTEFVAVAQARGIVSIAYLATLTPTKTQAWNSTTARIVGTPTTVGTNATVTVSLQVDGLDLSGARIVWEARDQEPAYGATFTFTPTSYGDQWIEAEAQWADGRRAVASASFFATNSLPTVSVVATDASMSEAGDMATYTFTRAGSTAAALTVNYKMSGTSAKWSDYRRPNTGDMPEFIVIPAGASSATLTVYAVDDTAVEGTETAILSLLSDAAYNRGTPNVATAYIYDNEGATLPTVTVTATDAIASENLLGVGVFTITRTGSLLAPLTINYTLGGSATQGVDYNATSLSLTLPIGISSAVVIITPVDDTAVEGEETVVLSLSGDGAYQMGTAASATISIADNDTATTLPTVSIAATDATASKVGPDTGTFTVTRTGNTASALTVNLAYSGTAVNGSDYNTLASTVTIPAGSTSTTVTVTPKTSSALTATTKTVTLASVATSAYTVGTTSADASITGNVVPIGAVKKETGGMRVIWNSVVGKTYRVVGKKNLTDTTWTELSGNIQATSTASGWLDTGATAQGFYQVYVTN